MPGDTLTVHELKTALRSLNTALPVRIVTPVTYEPVKRSHRPADTYQQLEDFLEEMLAAVRARKMIYMVQEPVAIAQYAKHVDIATGSPHLYYTE